jgi:uncharacterized protein (TIGR00369 family)
MAAVVMDKDQLTAFLREEFPQSRVSIEAVSVRGVTVRQAIGFEHLRPGGTVSGPALMAVADVALYLSILAIQGPVALAVTTSLTINFLRKPTGDAAVQGECRLLKVGKRLVVGEVTLYSEGSGLPVAHVTGTYSVPPDRPARAV